MKKTFMFRGREYDYLDHSYNETRQNERAVEVPIIWEIVNRAKGKRILEVGNVLSHYFPTNHLIVDLGERGKEVINRDIETFYSPEGFDLIISISTLEHIGRDRAPHDLTKVLRVLKHLMDLLKPEGELVITLPLGYHPTLDKLIKGDKIPFEERYCFQKDKENDWKLVPLEMVKKEEYGPVKKKVFVDGAEWVWRRTTHVLIGYLRGNKCQRK